MPESQKRMLHQPNLFPSEAQNDPDDRAQKAESEPQSQQPAPVWLQRAELFLRVVVRLYLGVFVLVLPWWSRFWDDNPLFTLYPRLGELASYGAVRGIISGLGVLNLWIALSEAIRYRETTQPNR